MANDERFLNFPVQLLQGAFADIRKTMNNIMDYAGYSHTQKLEYGDLEEQMEAAGNYFGVTWGSIDESYTNGERLYNRIPQNSPMTGISVNMCFDYFKDHKTHDEIAVLMAFLALKSIIGVKPYCKTTNDYLIARMGGYASIKDMPDPLPDPLGRYTTRRKLDRIKRELQLDWNVNIYAYHTRGWYVSVDNTFDIEKLIYEAEKRRKSTKEMQLEQKKNEARRKALMRLNPDELDF